MGSVCMKSVDDDDDYDDDGNKYGYGSSQQQNRQMNTVAMLASMAHQAGGLMNQMAHVAEHMDPLEYQERVRVAKAQMRTVTIRNDCLYIDYEFAGRIPPGMASLAY